MSIKKKILTKALSEDVVCSSGGEGSGGVEVSQERHHHPRKRQKVCENANVIPGRNVVQMRSSTTQALLGWSSGRQIDEKGELVSMADQKLNPEQKPERNINDIIAKYRNALAAASQIVRGNTGGNEKISDYRPNINTSVLTNNPMSQNYNKYLPNESLLNKRGRKPCVTRSAEDDKYLRGPLAPGDTYGIKMSGIIAIADNIMKQTTQVKDHVNSIFEKTQKNLQLLNDKVKSLMVDVDNKVVNILPGCTTIIKKKCKEHYQMHSYQILKQLQKDANMIQDTLCQLQNVDLSGFDTTMPEFEIPKQQEFQAEQKRLLKEQVELIIPEARVMEVVNELKQPVTSYNACLQAELDNSVIFLSSETTDIDCYKINFDQSKEQLELLFMQSFKDTPFFFFTHGPDNDRLLVDGDVFQMNTKERSCRKIQQIGFDLVGGCSLDIGQNNKEILISHGDGLHLSVWQWNGIDYVKRQAQKFNWDREKVASMLRLNKFAKGCVEIFCVSEENRLIKIQFQRTSMDKNQLKKLGSRTRKPILDYRIVRSDRVMILTEDDLLTLLDSFNGAELCTYSVADMTHKNIFTYLGDQFNLDTHSLIMEDTEDGCLWLVNMKISKDKVQKRVQIRCLNDFQPIKQLAFKIPGNLRIPAVKENQSEDEPREKKKSVMYILGVDVHEQVLALAEIKTHIEMS